jgi:hypothetical protein
MKLLRLESLRKFLGEAYSKRLANQNAKQHTKNTSLAL